MMTTQDGIQRLHRYLVDSHCVDGALLGPDPGIRLNYRFLRFAKSYLRAIPWADDLYYLQTQGYWVLANARLLVATGDARYQKLIIGCADEMLRRQRADGSWPYPNPEWRGRVATAEGVWASIGLLEAYRQTGYNRYLEGALRWHQFMIEVIGFQQVGCQAAINYFASTRRERIPNNSAFAIRFLAELADVLRDSTYLDPCPGMLEFLFAVQTSTGELPYAVEGPLGGKPAPHFQCYQYNAFQCLDLMRYYELTQDRCALPIIDNLLSFLLTGIHEDGHVAYECGERHRTVTYHSAVVAAALDAASGLGLGDYRDTAERVYGYVLSQQRPDGSFPHSRGDYRFLKDERSYPRYLAMILYHLLHHEMREPVLSGKE